MNAARGKKATEIKLEVADAGKMTAQEADDLAYLLATWITRDICGN